MDCYLNDSLSLYTSQSIRGPVLLDEQSARKIALTEPTTWKPDPSFTGIAFAPFISQFPPPKCSSVFKAIDGDSRFHRVRDQRNGRLPIEEWAIETAVASTTTARIRVMATVGG